MAQGRLALETRALSHSAGGERSSTDTVYDVRIERIAAGGAGVGRLGDGKVVFVHRTAPGDRVVVKLARRKPRWAEGELVEVLEAGPGRRQAPCALYDRCGGCALQHLDESRQLSLKSRVVADALQRIAGVVVELPSVSPSPVVRAYRSRMSFHLRRFPDGRVVAGLRALGDSGQVIDVMHECLLPEAPVAEAWTALRAGWGPRAERLPGGARLRLGLRRVSGGVLLLVEGGIGRGDPEALLSAVPALIAAWHRPDARAVPYLLAGARTAEEVWLGRTVRTGPSAFVQVNRTAAELMYHGLVRRIGDVRGKRVVDAYCGLGTLGRRLAEDGADVTAIEIHPVAARAAEDRAPQGFRMVRGAFEKRLEEVLPADLLVVNPPRRGLDERVAARLSAADVKRIVYVSCDPATLARDVRRLAPSFRLLHVECFDLFPQTAHVETLAILESSSAEPSAAASRGEESKIARRDGWTG